MFHTAVAANVNSNSTNNHTGAQNAFKIVDHTVLGNLILIKGGAAGMNDHEP